MIRRHGIPAHVQKLAPFNAEQAALSQDAFFQALRIYVRGYHDHSRLVLTPSITGNGTKARVRPPLDPLELRPPPKISRHRHVLTIRLNIFLSHLDAPEAVRRDWDSQVETVRAALLRAREDGSGIILDLRPHSGGNYAPVVSMFQDLFRNTTLFAWCNEMPSQGSRKWLTVRLKGRDRWMSTHSTYTGLETSGRFVSGELAYPCKLAILIGPRTYSSGEIAASMFVGKPGVRFFGKSSGGGLSVNEGVVISPGIKVNLTIALVATTDGVMHLDECLIPDEITDHPLRDARAWLLEGRLLS